MSDLGFESNCKHVKAIAKNTENIVKATHKATKALEAAANAVFEVASALSEFASMHNVNPIIRGDVEQLHNRLRLFHGGQSIGQLKMNEQRDVEWPAKEMSKNVDKVLSLASTRRDEADRVKKYAKDLNKMDKYQQHILQLNQHDLSFQCAVTDLNMHAEVLLHKFVNSFTQSHTNFLLDLVTSLQPATQCTANAIHANNYININNKDDYIDMNCNSSKSIIFGNTNNNMVNGNNGTCTATEPLPSSPSFISNMNYIHTNSNKTHNNNIPINANVSNVQIHCNVKNESVNRAQNLSSNSYCQRTPSASMPRSENLLPKNRYNNYPQNTIATSHATRETASYSPSQIVSHNQPSYSQTMTDYPNDYNTTQPAQIPIYATPPQKQNQIQTMQSKCDLRQQQSTQNQYQQQQQQLQKELHGPMISVSSTPTMQQREVDKQVAVPQSHPSQNIDHCNSNMHKTNNSSNNNDNKITAITNKDKKKLNNLISNIKNGDAQHNMYVQSTPHEHATQVAKRGTAFPITCKTNNIITTANNTNKTFTYANNNEKNYNKLFGNHQQYQQNSHKQQHICTNNQCNIVV